MITAEPSAATIDESVEESTRPLPATVPAGGGGSQGGSSPQNPWALFLVAMGGLGLVVSTAWLAVKR